MLVGSAEPGVFSRVVKWVSVTPAETALRFTVCGCAVKFVATTTASPPEPLRSRAGRIKRFIHLLSESVRWLPGATKRLQRMRSGQQTDQPTLRESLNKFPSAVFCV